VSAYLLTWNPNKSSFTDERYCEEYPGSPSNWSIGNLKRTIPQSGADFFFVRTGKSQGVWPLGIVGYGAFIGEPYLDQHWDDEKEARGETETYIDLQWTNQVHCLQYPNRVVPWELLLHHGLTDNDRPPQRPMSQYHGDVERLKELLDQRQRRQSNPS
jgi:hypothetical protein